MSDDQLSISQNNDIAKFIFGSRLYGTNDENSDFDYKVVFLPPLKDLLCTNKKIKNYKIRDAAPNEKVGAGEEECEFIPLQRFAIDFFNGQTYAYEIAITALSDKEHKYHEYLNSDISGLFYHFVDGLYSKFITNDISKMVGYAINQAMVYGLKGERLQILLDLVDVLSPVAQQPENWKLLDVKHLIDPLLGPRLRYTQVTGPNDELIDSIEVNNKKQFALTNGVKYFVKQLETMIAKYGHRANEATKDNVDWKALSHAIRIISQANDLLKFGKFDLPIKNAEYIKSIKQGLIPYEEAYDFFQSLNIEMEGLLKTSRLPSRTVELEEQFDEWFSNWMLTFYRFKEKNNNGTI